MQHEIATIEGELEVAVEQYNQAYLKLANVQRELAETDSRLAQAREDLRAGKDQLNRRLAGVYKSGQAVEMLDFIFSSDSMGELVRTINSIQAVSEQDAALVRQIKHNRQEIKKAQREIAASRKSQERITVTLAAKKTEIEKGLKEQRTALADVKSKISADEAIAARALRARAPAPLTQASPSPGRQSPESRPPQPSVKQTPSAPMPPPDANRAGQVVQIAMAQLGKPYVWAASGPDSFDCSGLTMFVYAQVGIGLPHSAAAQYNMGRRVSKDQLQPGDLIFGAHGGYISHVGIFIGNDQYINAPQTGDVVKISRLSTRANYIGAVRLL